MITLKRIAGSGEGTFGALIEDGVPFALTCERPWLENRAGISCIPKGWYTCRRTVSPRFGETFEVADVPGRSNIIFHAGNTPEDSRGCILVGRSFGALGGRAAVLSSRMAFREFMERLRGKDEFAISIEEV